MYGKAEYQKQQNETCHRKEGETSPPLEHKIAREQQFESSNVLNCKIVEEADKSS